ncbi:MAG: hypothetical protein ACYCSN_19790 [Acidobacteriaceae bacterium]
MRPKRDSIRRASALLLAGLLVAVFAAPQPARADNPFDLSGPQLQVRVTRAGKTLPIAEVPNLQPGDQLWLHPVLPAGQSIHFLLVAVFLRGTTNPPPDSWFTRAETWTKKVQQEGIRVTIPQDAQQALLFLAPVTGGDFDTLRSAVRSRPGQFVRAAQDLDVASLNRTRLERFLDGIESTSDYDPKQLQQKSLLLARSLNIKINEQCFDLPREQQASCLTQNSAQLVLDDPHTESMVAALTSGSASDLIGQVSGTPMAGGGAYSPYVGAIVDVIKIMGSIHTAHYQYLPALALANADTLSLKLNTPPSFENPKSVLVIGLPPVSAARQPPWRAADKLVYCLQQPSLVLPVDGAPLVFATSYAHDIFLRLPSPASQQTAANTSASSSKSPSSAAGTQIAALELPAIADPSRGGFRIDVSSLDGGVFPRNTTGTLHGSWGFDAFDGPSFDMQSVRKTDWSIKPADRDALVVGHDDTLLIHYDDASCVDNISVVDAAAKPLKATWKQSGPGVLSIAIPLQDASPGKLAVVIQPFSPGQQVSVPVQTYADAASVDGFVFHAGDDSGLLTGTRLDQVASLTLKTATFVPDVPAPPTAAPVPSDATTPAAPGSTSPAGAGPAPQSATTSTAAAPSDSATTPDNTASAANNGGLLLTAKDAAALSALRAGEKLTAIVALKDGRELKLRVAIGSARPVIALLSKSILPAAAESGAAIHLGNRDDLPQNASLSFFLKAKTSDFPRDEKIEVASDDGALRTTLSLANGTITLQDARTVMATLDPQKAFGGSAFGQLRFRAVSADGTAGAWQPLANLVRVPSLKNVQCPADPAQLCTLNGTNLFLIDSVAANPAFAQPTEVPPGIAESTLQVPRPNGTLLYLKLRDDPSAINTAALPVLPE